MGKELDDSLKIATDILDCAIKESSTRYTNTEIGVKLRAAYMGAFSLVAHAEYARRMNFSKDPTEV